MFIMHLESDDSYVFILKIIVHSHDTVPCIGGLPIDHVVMKCWGSDGQSTPLQVLLQATNNNDELFMALGAFALAYLMLLGGNGAVVATAELRGLVRMATAALTALDTYNMSTAVLGIVVR